jgi:hypothetical protein
MRNKLFELQNWYLLHTHSFADIKRITYSPSLAICALTSLLRNKSGSNSMVFWREKNPNSINDGVMKIKESIHFAIHNTTPSPINQQNSTASKIGKMVVAVVVMVGGKPCLVFLGLDRTCTSSNRQ